jgi:hypothetical protein
VSNGGASGPSQDADNPLGTGETPILMEGYATTHVLTGL